MKKKNVLKKCDVFGLDRMSNKTKLVSGNITLLESWEVCTDWYNLEKYIQMYIVYHTPEEVFTDKQQII